MHHSDPVLAGSLSVRQQRKQRRDGADVLGRGDIGGGYHASRKLIWSEYG
jgi:hypothetical protein